MLKEYKETSKNNSPLSFLSSRLSQFTKATRIFTTRDYTHTNVAAEFHQACDNIPNTLVIIKSGQYIAGGYTEVAWSSPPFLTVMPGYRSFLFSVNRQKDYSIVTTTEALRCRRDLGPVFGKNDLAVEDDYCGGTKGGAGGSSAISAYERGGVFSNSTELMGSKNFKVDEYEVYKLE